MDFYFFRRFFRGDIFTRDSIETNNEGNRNEVYFDDFSERWNSPNEMFKPMEDMFNKIFISSFGVLDFSKDGEMQPIQHSPRNTMLKDSDDNILTFEESDVSYPLLETSDSEMESFEKNHSFSYSQFSSIKTVHLPDGTIEEHHTVIDSDGKKTTKVRRSIGDSSHEVITKSDKQGIKEKEENFINLDENKVPDFERTWSSLKSDVDFPNDIYTFSLPAPSPSFFNLFKKLFSSSQEE